MNLIRAMARAFEERRFLLLVPPAIIAGVVTATLAPSAPEPVALSLAGGALLLALLLTQRSAVAFRMLIALGSVWFGFSLLFVHGVLFGTPMLAQPAYGTYEVQVDAVASETDTGKRVIVSEIAPLNKARPLMIRRARILVSTTAPLSPGDVIRAPIRFAPVPGPVAPGGFDTQFHAYFDGIGAYGNTTGPVELVRTGQSSAPARIIDGVRRTIGARIDAVLQQPAGGIARALITGDQTGVVKDAREVMATAGLAHVLSISGLHLTLVAGGFFVALRMLLSVWDGLARRISVKRLAAAGGIVAALIYFSISGGHVAALRATVMILLVFGAVIFGRRALTMRNVAIAALIVIVTDPASILRPSFQLSFSAVVALIGAWELARSSEQKERGLVRQFVNYFGGLALTSLVAGAATLLFSIYHFQQTSPLGLLGNLASLPLVGFVMMPAAVIGTLLMPFGFEGPFLATMGWSIDVMLGLAGGIADWSSGFGHSP
ncbi:MAG: ComEC/Rec2 family competence protein, partial [Devosia sp.]|nr:ComEC/Rec2 family competence protein [Devosia sp.]